ncbi:MAG: cupin domain-containing protein [Kordiimonadaceae bacterium]|nr:cupin domain-containing protein [Kordiimonadaceae bacterium]
MIVRRSNVRRGKEDNREWLYYSDDGGLTQYGADLETLLPGARSSDMHWHECEDEFLYVIEGEVTVKEGETNEILQPGDAACWQAGIPVAHTILNHTDQPCLYLIVGTRVTHDVCHYPRSGNTLYTEGEAWRLVDSTDQLISSGHCKSPPGRD